jgi:hypothetical protein
VQFWMILTEQKPCAAGRAWPQGKSWHCAGWLRRLGPFDRKFNFSTQRAPAT